VASTKVQQSAIAHDIDNIAHGTDIAENVVATTFPSGPVNYEISVFMYRRRFSPGPRR
jgi:hypothetical protein